MSAGTLDIRLKPSVTQIAFMVMVANQVLLLLAATRASIQDTWSILLTGALAFPLLAIPLILFPQAVLLLVPLLILIPGYVLGFIAAQWVFLAALLALGLRAGARRPAISVPAWLEIAFFLYAAWAAFAVLQAEDAHEAFGGLKRIVLFFLAFVAGRRFLGAHLVKPLLRVVALLPALIVVQLLATVGPAGFNVAALAINRGGVTDIGWGASNYVAAMASLAGAAALPLILYGRRWDRVLGAIGVLAAAIVSAVTMSRGGMLALTVLLLVAAALELRRRFFIVLALLTILATAFLVSPLGRASLLRFANPGELFSVGARVIFFQESIRIAGEHWTFGVGPNQIPFHTPYYIGPDPHNIFLRHAAELGLPGLILYCLLLGALFHTAVRFFRGAKQRTDRLAALSFILALSVAVVSASVEPTLPGAEYGLVFWLLMGTLHRKAGGRTTAERDAV